MEGNVPTTAVSLSCDRHHWVMAATCLSVHTLPCAAEAQVTNTIYYDPFNRTGVLNGSTASPVDTGNATWIAWHQLITDGSEISVTISTPSDGRNNGFLPLTPQVGYMYTFTVDIKGRSGANRWLALSVARNALMNNYYASSNIAVSWGLHPANATQAHLFLAPGTANHLANVTRSGDTNVFTIYSIVLNTTTRTATRGWTVTFYRSGVLLARRVSGTNPSIHYIGIGAAKATGYYCNFRLANYFADVVPVITQDPVASTNVNLNGMLVVSAAAIGKAAMAYQWYDTNNVPVTGQTNVTIVITHVQNGDSYYMRVTNSSGSATLTPVVVKVISGCPAIVGDLPTQVEVRMRRNYYYSLVVNGSDPLHYQSLVDGTLINSTTDATFAPTTGTPGTYSVYAVVTNVYNGTTPETAVISTSILTVNPAILSSSTYAVGYWAAPAMAATGDGSSPANAAYYLNSTFRSMVQRQLWLTNVILNLLDGSYNLGTLVLQDMRNPLHRMILQAVNLYAAAFTPRATIFSK